MKRKNIVFLSLALVMIASMSLFLSGCLFDSTPDVAVNELYYCAPSRINTEDIREVDFLIFVDKTNFIYTTEQKTVSNQTKYSILAEFEEEDYLPTTNKIVNGKKVYTYETGEGRSIEITVVSQDTLHVKFVNNSTIEFDMTRYVA